MISQDSELLFKIDQLGESTNACEQTINLTFFQESYFQDISKDLIRKLHKVSPTKFYLDYFHGKNTTNIWNTIQMIVICHPKRNCIFQKSITSHLTQRFDTITMGNVCVTYPSCLFLHYTCDLVLAESFGQPYWGAPDQPVNRIQQWRSWRGLWDDR